MLSAKFFGPEGRGYIAGATTMASLMASIGGLSIGRVLVFEITRQKLTPQEYFRRNLYSLLTIGIILTAIIYLVAILISLIYPSFYGKVDNNFYFIAFLTVPAIIWSAQSMYLFSSLNRLPVQNSMSLLVQITYVASAALAVMYFKLGLITFLCLMTASSIGTFALEVMFISRLVKPECTVHWDEIAILVKNGLKIHLDTIGGILITSANILILNYYLTPRDVGIYQLAMQLVSMIIIVPSVISLTFNHDIAVLGHDAALLKHIKYYWSVMFLMILICICAYFLIPYAMLLVASSKFNESIVIFRLLLFSVIGNTFCTLMGPQLTSRGYFKFLSGSTLVFGGGGLLISMYMIKKYQMAGAAYSTIALYTVAMICNLFFFGYLKRKASGNCNLNSVSAA